MSRSLTGGGRLREVSTVRLKLRKFGVLAKRSLTRGGRLREVVADGGSTVLLFTIQFPYMK